MTDRLGRRFHGIATDPELRGTRKAVPPPEADGRKRPRRQCVQCGAFIRRGEFAHGWPTGAVSCELCFLADFG